jgi:circadian clock protein KaiB
MIKKPGHGQAAKAEDGDDLLDLRLYVADKTPRCLVAYENLRKICEEHAQGPYRITVIDLLKDPGIARTDDITAIPTLVRVPRSQGHRKIIGMLTNTTKVIEQLDLNKRTIYPSQGTIRKRVPAQ